MRTLVMDWEDFQSNNQIQSDIQVVIRPPIVPWHEEPLPPMIKQEYSEWVDDYCCCAFKSYGYSSYGSNFNPAPVSENSTTTMLGFGLLIILGIIYLKSIKIIK